jgi:hypothetical protein
MATFVIITFFSQVADKEVNSNINAFLRNDLKLFRVGLKLGLGLEKNEKVVVQPLRSNLLSLHNDFPLHFQIIPNKDTKLAQNERIKVRLLGFIHQFCECLYEVPFEVQIVDPRAQDSQSTLFYTYYDPLKTGP